MKTNIFRSLSAVAILATGLTLSTTGCKQTEDDIFDKSVNERVEAQVQELRSLLISSTEGWILDYIPSAGQQYGAYYIGLKFSDKDEVLATTDELKTTEKWYKSTYTVGKDKNVSLNFDTGNMAIHRYTTPDSTYAGGISLGYEGDSEFNLVKIVSQNEIQVRGKKTRNLMTLRRATGSIDDFMASIRSMKAQIFNPAEMGRNYQDALVGNLGGKSQLFKLNATGLNVYTYTVEGDTKTYTASYFVTPTGIRFVKPIEGVSEMTWADGKLNAGTANLTARRDPSRDKYEALLGNYTLTVNDNVHYDVTFTESAYNTYLITGLPFNIVATYNPNRDRFEIVNQVLTTIANDTKVVLCAWDTGARYLSWGLNGTGMYASLEANSNPKKYVMYDNGVWGEYKSNAWILWKVNSAGAGAGEYTDYTGVVSRMSKPTFTRKTN